MSFNVDAFNSASSIAQKRRASGRQLSDGVCTCVCVCLRVCVCVCSHTHTHTHSHTHTGSQKINDVQIVDNFLSSRLLDSLSFFKKKKENESSNPLLSRM